MKLSFSISLLLLFSCVAWAQRKYEAYDVLNEKVIVPPNGILIRDSLFLDDSEVTNMQYLGYLHSLAQDSSEQALINAYPDTNIFGSRHLKHLLHHKREYHRKKGNKHLPITTLRHDEEIHEPSNQHHWWNYFSYHDTKHCPVVGVSYKQALSYCKWRSNYITAYFNDQLKNKSKYNAFDNKKVRFEFSLPTSADWELAACDGLDSIRYPLGCTSVEKDSSNMFNIQFRETTLATKNKKHPEFIFSHPPNNQGFYNLIGNAGEMTAEYGVSKGGSYEHYAPECQIKKSISYSHPEKWLGFRCVCKVIVEPLIP